MSDLRSLIHRSKNAGDLVASTVRMPREMALFVEGLAEKVGLSKHEITIKLIEAGIEIAEKELESERIIDSTFHVLNTNKRHDDNDQDVMLEKGIAAAFYDPWKKNIERIKKGDTVFLYENGVGIIAYGVGSGETLKAPRYDDEDECFYQELSDFEVLKNPISASEIKKILGRNVVFLRTMSGMPDGDKILSAIRKS